MLTPDPVIEFVEIEEQVLADLRIGDPFLGDERFLDCERLIEAERARDPPFDVGRFFDVERVRDLLEAGNHASFGHAVEIGALDAQLRGDAVDEPSGDCPFVALDEVEIGRRNPDPAGEFALRQFAIPAQRPDFQTGQVSGHLSSSTYPRIKNLQQLHIII